MLRKHTLGFTGVMAAAITVAIAAAGCSSTGAGKVVSVGPTFASQSLYATNTTQNGVSIYPVGQTSGGPQYQIGGSNTTLGGPQFVTLDSVGNIYTTNWAAGTNNASILEFEDLATGNAVPYGTTTLSNLHPRGIFDYQTTLPGSSTKVDVLVAAVVDAGQTNGTFANQLQFFQTNPLGSGAYEIVAGPLTCMGVPVGVGADKSGTVYVANSQVAPSRSTGCATTANVEVFSVATPTAIPSPTATPTASPSPTPTPSGATASPTPTVAPTATPVNIAPTVIITNGIGLPTGIALDSSGDLYVADQATKATGCGGKAAILRFGVGAFTLAPTALCGSSTLLYAPTDVKVDSSGKIYVADSTATGANVIYVFASGATGNVAPTSTLTSPGAVTGLGLSP